MTKQELDSVSRVISRFLHLVSKGKQEEACELYGEVWDATALSGVFLDYDLVRRFAVRAYSFNSEYLEILAHTGRQSEKLLTEYYVHTLTQLHQSFMDYYEVMKLSVGEDYPVKQYIPFLLSGDVHKLLKYQTCVFWNVHLDSPKEEYPTAGVFEGLPLFFGNTRGKTFLGRNKKNTFIQYSTFQGFKKCLPPLPIPLIWHEFEQLESDLTQRPSEFSKKRIRRYVGYLTKGLRCSDPQLSYSFGASFSMSRAEGGQLAELLNAFNIWREKQDGSPAQYQITPVLRGWTLDAGKMISQWSEGPTYEDVVEFWFSRFAFSSPKVDYGQRADALPLGILEPLKVRIITKGDALTLCGLHHVKDDLRRALRRVPNGTFDLIFGSIQSSWDWKTKEFWRYKDEGALSMEDCKSWDSFFGSLLDYDPPETCLGRTFWNSGDYSAATNKCNGAISLYTLQCFMSALGYDAELSWRAERSLLGNTMHFSPEKCLPFEAFGFPRPRGALDDHNRSYVQTNGQLMGSVISFPILCMMNLFAYWQAVEEYIGRELTLTELVCRYPLRINGDDILFPCNRSFYETWSRVISSYGFHKSVGKNLILEDRFTINSVYYIEIPQQPINVQAVPYLNFGFLNGVKKGDGASDTISRATRRGRDFQEYVYSSKFWSSAAEGWCAIDRLPGGYRQRARNCFIRTYRPYLEEQGWSEKEWELNHSLVFTLPSGEKCETHFPHRKEEENGLFLLDDVYKRVRTPVRSMDKKPMKLPCQEIGVSYSL